MLAVVLLHTLTRIAAPLWKIVEKFHAKLIPFGESLFIGDFHAPRRKLWAIPSRFQQPNRFATVYFDTRLIETLEGSRTILWTRF